MQAKRKLLLKLHLCQGIGLVSTYRLLNWLLDHEHVQLNAQDIIEITHLPINNQQTFKDCFNSSALQKLVDDHLAQTQFITIIDCEYPQRLAEIYLPPIVLFYQGDLSCLNQATIGIVGARQANYYTKIALQQLIVPELSATIVSGLAKGADTFAHEIALKNGLKTIAVIGNGLACYYPKQNQALQQLISQKGLVLSEYPLQQAPKPFQFPMRNRIIAGLCHSLVVTQAKSKSGSLITANYALQANRQVYAIPGNINEPLSRGCNELIVAGATPLIETKILQEELQSY